MKSARMRQALEAWRILRAFGPTSSDWPRDGNKGRQRNQSHSITSPDGKRIDHYSEHPELDVVAEPIVCRDICGFYIERLEQG